MASRYRPSGVGPPIILASEHMSKKRGRSASASTDSSVHRPVTLAMASRPSSSSRSSDGASSIVWVASAIARKPAELSAGDAVLAAYEGLGDGFDAISGQVRELATLTRSSPVFSAWTLQIYLRYEEAIAALVAPRLGDPAPEDPRPRLIGALAMASIRIALDDWLLYGGSPPAPRRT